MKFEELWIKVSALKVLPETAILLIPSALSNEAKINCVRERQRRLPILFKQQSMK